MKIGDLFYDITGDSTVEVISANYLGMTTVTIPETVTYRGKAYSVTSIGDCAFYYCKSLTSATIPSSVTSIGTRAFYGCYRLTSVTFAENSQLISIDRHAFAFCTGLTSVTIPNSVTVIGESAFFGVKHINYNGYATGSPWGAIAMTTNLEVKRS